MEKLSAKSFWVILYVAVGYVVFCFLPNSPIRELDENYSNKNVLQNYQNVSKGPNFTIGVAIEPTSLKDINQNLNLSISSLILYGRPPHSVNDGQVCINEVVFFFWERTGSEIIDFPFENNSLCTSLMPSPINLHTRYFPFNFNSVNLSALQKSVTNNDDVFYYPFDGFEYSLMPLIKYSVVDGQGNSLYSDILIPLTSISNLGNFEWTSNQLTPNLNFYSEIDQIWNIDEYSDFQTVAHNVSTSPYIISYIRPFPLRIIFIIFVLSLTLIIGFLASTKSIDTFINGSIGVLFGIYGFRQIMYIETVSVRTMVDVAIIGLFIVYFCAVAFQFIGYMRHESRMSRNESGSNNNNKKYFHNSSKNTSPFKLNKSK